MLSYFWPIKNKLNKWWRIIEIYQFMKKYYIYSKFTNRKVFK